MLPQSEYDRLQKIAYNGLTNGSDLLTDFDQKFLNDFSTKFEQYRRHTFVSDKQSEQFDRIEKYLRDELGHRYED